MLLNFIIISLCFNMPTKYSSVKTIKKLYYNNLLTYDIYKNDIITNNTLLTAEHIFPKSLTKYYIYAKYDMHNIFLTSAETNIYRSNYKFANETINQKIHYSNIYKFYIPCDFARGQIARTLAYMKFIYPKLEIDLVIDRDILINWNKKYLVNELENKRNYLIKKEQGNSNPFIDDPEKLELLF